MWSERRGHKKFPDPDTNETQVIHQVVTLFLLYVLSFYGSVSNSNKTASNDLTTVINVLIKV